MEKFTVCYSFSHWWGTISYLLVPVLNALNIQYPQNAHHWHFQLPSSALPSPSSLKRLSGRSGPRKPLFIHGNREVSPEMCLNIVWEKSLEKLVPEALDIGCNQEKLLSECCHKWKHSLSPSLRKTVKEEKRIPYKKGKHTDKHWSPTVWVREDTWLSPPAQKKERT